MELGKMKAVEQVADFEEPTFAVDTAADVTAKAEETVVAMNSQTVSV